MTLQNPPTPIAESETAALDHAPLIPITERKPYGRIIAENVSYETYLEQYAEHACEWVKGYVIKISPVNIKHQFYTDLYKVFLLAYLALNPIGIVVGEKFVMKTEAIPSGREPDVMVILNSNPGSFTPTQMLGAADICIEIVSPSTEDTDLSEKLREYEASGVKEYWICDYNREDMRFYRLNQAGTYILQPLDADGNCTTPLLPNFRLHVATLWETPLPNFYEIGDMVKAMFA